MDDLNVCSKLKHQNHMNSLSNTYTMHNKRDPIYLLLGIKNKFTLINFLCPFNCLWEDNSVVLFSNNLIIESDDPVASLSKPSIKSMTPRLLDLPYEFYESKTYLELIIFLFFNFTKDLL